LQGYRLANGAFQRLKADSHGALLSRELGVRLQADEGQLNFYRTNTGERILTPDEERELAEAARRTEAKARQVAEAEVARLRRELRRLTKLRPLNEE
jgi:hypothetical protein